MHEEHKRSLQISPYRLHDKYLHQSSQQFLDLDYAISSILCQRSWGRLGYTESNYGIFVGFNPRENLDRLDP